MLGPFRDIAKHSIATEIGKIAVESGATEVTRDHCIKGYIVATPKAGLQIPDEFPPDEGNRLQALSAFN